MKERWRKERNMEWNEYKGEKWKKHIHGLQIRNVTQLWLFSIIIIKSIVVWEESKNSQAWNTLER